MGRVMVNESSLQDIAAAIREKTESTDTFLPSTMGAAIRGLKMDMQYATGTVKAPSSSTNTLTITGLSFEPKVVVIHYIASTANSNNAWVVAAPEWAYGRSSGGYIVTGSTLTFSNGTCTLVATMSGSYLFYQNTTYGWYACG